MVRFVSLLCLALALAVLVADLMPVLTGQGAFRLSALGEWWAWAHQTSLIGLNSTVEKRLSPEIWDTIFLPVLEWPLAVQLIVLAVVLWLLRRRRRRSLPPRRRDLDLKRK